MQNNKSYLQNELKESINGEGLFTIGKPLRYNWTWNKQLNKTKDEWAANINGLRLVLDKPNPTYSQPNFISKSIS